LPQDADMDYDCDTTAVLPSKIDFVTSNDKKI
jgi:hypothetical protein